MTMQWQEAFDLSLIEHRAPHLSFLCWALDVEVKSIVEIGVNRGETSQLFRNLFPQAQLFLVDPWQLTSNYLLSGTPISRKNRHYAQAYHHVSTLFQDDPQVTIYRMPSTQAAALVPNEIDLVFIDGNHEYAEVKQDIQSWLPKVRRGGLLAGHDYAPNIPMFSGVKAAVDEKFGTKIILGKDRLWIHRKN